MPWIRAAYWIAACRSFHCRGWSTRTTRARLRHPMTIVRWIVGVVDLPVPAAAFRCRTRNRSSCASITWVSWEAPLIFLLLIVFRRRGHRRPAGRRVSRGAPEAPDSRACAASSAEHGRRRTAAPGPSRALPGDGFRALVAAADPGAVLRAGLDRRAHRHQAPVARIARAAAVVLSRPQLPAQRAAGQGDRVVHRGRQGRPADDRPALRAGQPVPPPGRDRPRDPHAPEPARPRRPARRDKRAGRAVRARAGLPPRGPARSRRGAVHEARRQRVRAAVAGLSAADLRAGKGLAEGDRRDAAHGGAGQAPVLQGDRALLLRARAGCAAALAVRRSRARASIRRWPNTSCARARRSCWATSRRNRATTPAAIAAWQRIESQNPAYLGLVAERLADALPPHR